MKYQKGVSVWAIILVVTIIIVTIGGYVWYETTPTQQTQEIAQAVVTPEQSATPTSDTPQASSAVVSPSPSPVAQVVEQKVVEHTAQAVINSLDEARQKGNNNMIQAYLSSFRSSAEFYFSSQNPNSYGIPVTGTAGCSAPNSMFVSNVYEGNVNYKTLLHPNDYPSGTQLVCNVSTGGQAYAVQANLIGGGYWCVDSTGTSKNESSPLGTKTSCQ